MCCAAQQLQQCTATCPCSLPFWRVPSGNSQPLTGSAVKTPTPRCLLVQVGRCYYDPFWRASPRCWRQAIGIVHNHQRTMHLMHSQHLYHIRFERFMISPTVSALARRYSNKEIGNPSCRAVHLYRTSGYSILLSSYSLVNCSALFIPYKA